MARESSIAVAMSGGVDSSVAAALLVEAGHSVFGIMLRLWSAPGVTNRCCSPVDVERARRVARQLEIPFYVLDMKDAFREHVVSVFLNGYAQGATPNPCIECNRQIRWTHLLQAAKSMGASRLATGHYARLMPTPDGIMLRRGLEAGKDQSYVLGMLTQEQLSMAAFPVGNHTKPQVREHARRRGFDVSERADSQDLCFLGGRNYREVLRELDGAVLLSGPILDVGGRTLGQHQGLADFTIGQRKGIGVAGPEALYVIAKDVSRNALVVGPKSALGRTAFQTGRVNWTAGRPPAFPRNTGVQIRYHSTARSAVLRDLPSGGAEVCLDEPAPDVTPGQYAVFYDGDRCLGGGMILG